MCGISGIINKSDRCVSPSEIKAITDPVIHRGPDNEGYYFGRNFAFGHRRLSIIDLSDSANQPMTWQGKYSITFNGEIYNYIEIREKLIQSGYHFSTGSDTEVILAAYDCHGYDCVTLFNGMWAFAIFDAEKDVIFCSRDRFGVKPFYYSENPGWFIFGSEIKQLLPIQKKNSINFPVLIDYLVASLDDHTNQTFFQNIFKLEQSHNLIYDLKNHKFQKYRYYEIKIHEDLHLLSEKESVEHYLNLLSDSVKIRMRSDVKVGACLSGGLDSSGIVALSSSLYRTEDNTKFATVTARSTESKYDESKYASLVSSHCGSDWHVVTPDIGDFKEDISRIIKIQEEPFGSPSIYMQYKVFEKARMAGCTVMLDGQGGDETLLGYERYYPAYLLASGKMNFLRNIFASWKNSRLSLFEVLSYHLYFTQPKVRMHRLESKFGFINNHYIEMLNKKMLIKSAEAYRNIMDLQKDEIETVQLPHLLKYEDRNSMAHSIESRLPYIDFRLVEAAISINNKFKIKDGWSKYLLRRALEKKLPSSIVWRTDKIGFNAPEISWIGSMNDQMKAQISKSEILCQICDKRSISNAYDNLDLRAKWRLFNIAKWEEIFNIGI